MSTLLKLNFGHGTPLHLPLNAAKLIARSTLEDWRQQTICHPHEACFEAQRVIVVVVVLTVTTVLKLYNLLIINWFC